MPASSRQGAAAATDANLSAHHTQLAPASTAAAPPTKKDTSRPLPDTYSELVASVASFLAVSIHQILYLRSIYPQYTFLPVRQFNHPVRQSRHPRVCTWISDACMAVETQLLKCTVAAVSVVILSVHTNRPLERYTFDMSQMPHVPASDIHTPFERSAPNKPSADDSKNTNTNNNPASVDLEAQFRAVLARLASACARLTPLPAEEEYLPTLHIVLRPDADAPAGVTKDEQLWIAADPEHLENDDESLRGFSDSEFGDSRSQRDAGDGQGPEGQNKRSRARAKTVPVRTVDAGEVKLEVWVEEAKGKFEELDRIHSENSPC